MKCQVSQWPETGHWLFGVFCGGGGEGGCEVSINGCSVWLVTRDTWKCFIHLILQLCLCMSLSGPIVQLVMGLFSFFFLAHTSHQQITVWTSGCSPISCLQMSVPSMPTSVTSTRMRLEFLISVLLSHINSLTRAPHVGHSSGAVWESRWSSWAVRPNEPSGFRGCKDLLNRASALVTTCP